MILRSRILACASGLLLLSACSDLGRDVTAGEALGSISGGGSTTGTDDADSPAARPTQSDMNGGVPGTFAVGDEPFAVRAGALILSQGGSAADAATAMYFALSVTYPVAAGLGGGGICLVHDTASGRTDEFDFLARDSGGGGAYAVPGNIRGFAALQGAYGVLPWQRDVSPGEGLASTGFPISRALSARLATTLDVVRLDAGLAAEFLDESGNARPVGTVVSNTDLAQTLSAIRLGGPDAFYKGEVGARILAYSQAQGGAIGVPEFARYGVTRGNPQLLQLGNQSVYLPSAQTGAGAFSGALFGTLIEAQQTQAGSGDLQAAIVVAVKHALARFGVTNLPPDLGSTGFAARDSAGQSVSCAVTMNGPFGSGHNATGTGVTLARAPSSGPAGIAGAFLTPVIATQGSSVSLVGVGAGGPNGTAAVGYALARMGQGEALIRRTDLRSTGLAPFETVNAITCQSDACVSLSDPSAYGLGAAGDSR
ncbi:MAG TPA: gamma-glutamyltransferase [Rhizomicrobium sp.]|nr:gamma-glutamyltransferase [Rhizomicrobium sp.]